MRALLLILACVLVLGGCCKKHDGVGSVREYAVHNAVDDSWLYYYVFLDSNRNYNYATSSSPVTSLRGATWTTSTTSPIPASSARTEVTERDVEVEVDEDVEAAAEGDDSSDSSSETSADSAEGDTSSESSVDTGDSGGGDSGGDSGGGGE